MSKPRKLSIRRRVIFTVAAVLMKINVGRTESFRALFNGAQECHWPGGSRIEIYTPRVCGVVINWRVAHASAFPVSRVDDEF